MNNIDKLYNNEILFFSNEPEYFDNITHIFPGSFNPIHDGHLEMMAKSGVTYAAELSIENVDKGRIDKKELVSRILKFEYYNIPYCISRCPTFVSKLAIKRNFIMGQDTFDRLIDPKYCNLDYLKHKMQFSNFIVFGRGDKKFEPNTFWRIRTKFIPYNNDISSSRIRDENR